MASAPPPRYGASAGRTRREGHDGMQRDIERDPYSKDEARIAEFLCESGAGGGDDPVGFIIASHRYMAMERNLFRDRLRAAGLSTELDEEPAPGPQAA